MNRIFEECFANLNDMLNDTVDNFSTGYEIYNMEPLFCVSKKAFNLMRTVAHYSDYQILNVCREMCLKLCGQYGIEAKQTPEYKEIDFMAIINGVKTGFFVTHAYKFMPDIKDAIEDGIVSVVNICLRFAKDGKEIVHKGNSKAYGKYPYRDIIENITIRQFFEMVGSDEYGEFLEYVGHYNYNAEQKLGITVSSIPTKSAMEKHKKKVKDDLLSSFYEDEMRKCFTSMEISGMKKVFAEKCDTMLSDTDFAKSFLSSEWYYDLQIKTDVGLEQTAIVAGYLKSVEQLICSILLSMGDKYEFKFHTTKEVKEKTGEKRMELSLSNLKSLNITLGTLICAIEYDKGNIIREKKPKE